MHNVPRTQVTKTDRLSEAIEKIIVYHELAINAEIILQNQGQLPELKKVRLIIEAEFCRNILFNVFKITPAVFEDTVRKLHQHPKFKEELESFCDSIVGRKRNKILITPNEAEVQQLGTRNIKLLKKLRGLK